ncbi:MAG: DUF481 domain-containing protein [bacterium]|nr:DUF481 domain-containing protein [bacterium]
MKQKKYMKYILTAYTAMIFFLAPVNLLNAKVNLEQYYYLDEKQGFQGAVKLAFMYNHGQEDILQVETAAGFGFHKGKWALLMVGDLMYGEHNDTAFLKQSYLHTRAALELSNPLSIEALFHIETDKFNALERKTYIGGGLRLALDKIGHKKDPNPHFDINTGAGLLWDKETYRTAAGQAAGEDISYLKATSYLSIKWQMNPHVHLISMTHFFLAFKETEEHNLDWEFSVTAAFSKHLSFLVSLKYAYDNIPSAAAVPKSDTTVTAGLKWRF